MKPWVPVLFVAVLLPMTPGRAVAADALAPGSWSAQFSVQPDFQLGSFQGSVLSLKRHLASGRAIRLGLSFSTLSLSDDAVRTQGDTAFTNTETIGGDVNGWSIGVNSYYLWYSSAAAPIHAYWGGGPFASLSGSGDDQIRALSSTGGPAGTITSHADASGWQAGLAGALGVEWLAAKRISFFAEYGVSLSYASLSDTRESVLTPAAGSPSTSTQTHDSQRIQFGGSGVRLGLSAYF